MAETTKATPHRGVVARAKHALADFCALAARQLFSGPRRLVLRAVGLVAVFVFAGIVAEGRALMGPA